MTTEERLDTLERQVAELQAKVTSIENDLALVPGLVTTGFRQVRSEMAAFRAHVDERFDATVRAIAGLIEERKEAIVSWTGAPYEVFLSPALASPICGS
jgi:hypothetical protein